MLDQKNKMGFPRKSFIFIFVFIIVVGFNYPAEAGFFSKIGKGVSKIFSKFTKKEADDLGEKGVKKSLNKHTDDVVKKGAKGHPPNVGKKEFYPKGEEALTSGGYRYLDGDKAIKGKGRAHRRKPDYIAEKDNKVVIGETKSPDEPPTSSSWRHRQPNDSQEIANVRADVAAREKAGKLDPEVGGHEIIIRGQIPDYAKNIGKTYDMPVDAAGKKIMGGYTVDASQYKNVEQALKNCGKSSYEKINNGNGSITYIFNL